MMITDIQLCWQKLLVIHPLNVPSSSVQELPAIEHKDQTDANGCTKHNESQSNILDIEEDYMSEIKPARPPGFGKSTLLLALTGKLDTSLEVTKTHSELYFWSCNYFYI
nr:protein photoperiod-independent early flowering 1 isoform X1 [Tanacetum cinerariifolium]